VDSIEDGWVREKDGWVYDKTNWRGYEQLGNLLNFLIQPNLAIDKSIASKTSLSYPFLVPNPIPLINQILVFG